MEEYVLICENSMEGILTGIYNAYQYKKEHGIKSHNQIHLDVKEPDIHRLFTEYICVETDSQKAEKVIKTLKAQLGESTYFDLCLAMASGAADKADAVYHTVVAGLSSHNRNIFYRLQDHYINRAFACKRGTANELHHYKEFLRFAELENGILYAKIGARDNILSFLMPHFADRLPAENFVIYDELYELFGLHPKYKQWYLAQGYDFNEDTLVFAQAEAEYQELFKHFCKSLAVESRKNPKLQMNMLPLRFRKYMVEFD